MDSERARKLLLSLPHAREALQWGDNLVFWVGDKTAGGKMFALMDLSLQNGLVIAFAAGPERAAMLLEHEGFRPAPYLARAHWVAAERWDVLRSNAWLPELTQAHAYVLGRMGTKVRTGLLSQACTPSTGWP